MEPRARGRLVRTAHDIFHERGDDRTTVAEIAARAGVTRARADRDGAHRDLDRIIAAHPELRERALEKRAVLTRTLVERLRARAIAERPARLAADLGIVAFYAGFERQIAEDGGLELKAVVAAS